MLAVALTIDFRQHAGRLPLGSIAVYWESAWIVLPLIVALPGIVLFPDGRIPSKRWRRLMWLYAALGTIFVAAQIAGQFGIHVGRRYPIDIRGKPTGDQGGGIAGIGWLIPPALVVYWFAFVGHQVNRWRRATGIERARLKWLMSAEAIVAAFSTRLRDPIDPDTVHAELLEAVERAIQPAYASIWARPSGI